MSNASWVVFREVVFKRVIGWFLLIFFLGFSGPGCSQRATKREPQKSQSLILATTTSVVDSGLLDYLLPDFEKETGLKVKVLAVGSGEALRLGKEGQADVILTHAPALEKKFLAQGYGKHYQKIMHNYFLVVGSSQNPAGLKGLKEAPAAFKKIFETKALFVSRGDESGTHQKEKEIWEKAKLKPARHPPRRTLGGRKWYLESGQGMGETLTIASEKGAYTLTDIGTYLSFKKNLRLKIMVKDGKALLNPYSVMAVNPQKYPQVNYGGAKEFIFFLTSKKVQQKIGNFGKKKYNQSLFIPSGR